MIANCYVYLITETSTPKLGGSPAVKIGLAVNCQRRVKELQTGNARRLELVMTIGPMDDKKAARLERHLHSKFKKYRLVGEWFQPDVIKALQNNYDLKYEGDIQILYSQCEKELDMRLVQRASHYGI